jgi:hypothetical protein
MPFMDLRPPDGADIFIRNQGKIKPKSEFRWERNFDLWKFVHSMSKIHGLSAPVAQLDRALASGAKGCGFDPRRAQFNPRVLVNSPNI